jgi:hypothetical protein
MSFPYTPNLRDAKLESLHTQHDFLNMLRLRQLHWMNTVDDPNVEVIHQEIAELLGQVTDRYNHLLEILQK